MDLSASIPPDLQPFVTEWLASGRYQSGREFVCEALRVLAEQDAADQEDDFEAIDEALESLRRGEQGMPLAQFASEFREQHDLDAEEQEDALTLKALEDAKRGEQGIELHEFAAKLLNTMLNSKIDLANPGSEIIMDLSASVPPDLQPFVTEWLASGRYESGQELLCDALRLLAEQDAEDEADELAILHAEVDEMDRGVPGKPLDQVVAEMSEKYGLRRAP